MAINKRIPLMPHPVQGNFKQPFEMNTRISRIENQATMSNKDCT